MKGLYERVADRCNRGGLPVGAAAVAEIDRFLAEARRLARMGRAA